MSAPLDPLILDLLDWLAARPRTYAEVMQAWRTSCPRLPVWEDANDRGFITRGDEIDGAIVGLTPSGREFLARHRGLPA